MAIANWKVTIEYTSDDGEGKPGTVVVSQTGSWDSTNPGRPPNECVAITSSLVHRMLEESGMLVGASEFKDTIEAFAD